MSAENNIEIKLISDYRELLLSKIESLKGSVNQVASAFGNEISSSIEEFTKKINGKLKSIDERFTKNTEELESLRAELVSKKFDESNFNNVSMIRTLDKTIKERDNKIRELESRIRYLEGNSASTNVVSTGSVMKKEPAAAIKQKQKQETITTKEVAKEPEQEQEPEPVVVPVPVPVIASEKDEIIKDASAPRVLDADGDIVIAVSAKKSRSKTTKKQAEPASVMPEASNAIAEPVVEEKPKKPIRKIKKASKVEKEEEASAEPVVPIPASTPITNPEPEQTNDSARVVDIDEDNDATEAQRLADEEALRLAQEEAAEDERLAERLAKEQRIAEEEAAEAAEAERLAEEKRLEEERAAKAAAELEKKKKTEVVKKHVIGKKDSNATKEPITSKKITSKTASSTPVAAVAQVPVPVPVPVIPTPSSSKTKETSKVKQGYPDKLPEIEDLDVITVNENDYYCDKNNQAVYQMINGDDIGTFLGYYDLQSETIHAIEEE